MSLKTDYKNDKFSGMRKYKIETDSETGLSTLDDKTEYVEVGDIFSADDINNTNKAINKIISIHTTTQVVTANLHNYSYLYPSIFI